MSHSIKLSDDTYNHLREFQGKRESYSQAIDRLLALMEKTGELKAIFEGQASFETWKAEQILTLGTAHTTALVSKEADHEH